jgi:hypothetical protein
MSVATLEPLLPGDTELIVSDRVLEPGGIELLRDLLAEGDRRSA